MALNLTLPPLNAYQIIERNGFITRSGHTPVWLDDYPPSGALLYIGAVGVSARLQADELRRLAEILNDAANRADHAAATTPQES